MFKKPRLSVSLTGLKSALVGTLKSLPHFFIFTSVWSGFVLFWEQFDFQILGSAPLVVVHSVILLLASALSIVGRVLFPFTGSIIEPYAWLRPGFFSFVFLYFCFRSWRAGNKKSALFFFLGYLAESFTRWLVSDWIVNLS